MIGTRFLFLKLEALFNLWLWLPIIYETMLISFFSIKRLLLEVPMGLYLLGMDLTKNDFVFITATLQPFQPLLLVLTEIR